MQNEPDHRRSAVVGVLCGAGAALFWAAGFAAARHGIDAGFSPADLTFHRCAWVGLALLPFVGRSHVGFGRAAALTLFGGPGIAIISYSGFVLVPLGHGAVIQPSCAALFGIVLAALVLKEPLPTRRVLGALTIVAGLLVIGGEAVAGIGSSGVAGDFLFVLAGAFFATFGTLLRLWRIDAIRATVVVSVVSLIVIPLHALFAGFERMIALGLTENLIQAVAQGLLAGPGAVYLFTRSVVLLGAARAAVFPSLVPAFTLLIGTLALGQPPSLLQLIGLTIVLAGFRLTQKP